MLHHFSCLNHHVSYCFPHFSSIFHGDSARSPRTSRAVPGILQDQLLTSLALSLLWQRCLELGRCSTSGVGDSSVARWWLKKTKSSSDGKSYYVLLLQCPCVFVFVCLFVCVCVCDYGFLDVLYFYGKSGLCVWCVMCDVFFFFTKFSWWEMHPTWNEYEYVVLSGIP